MPPAVASIAVVITGRVPKRATTRGASVEPAKMERVIGRNPRPASIAL